MTIQPETGEYVQVSTTTESREDAQAIADRLVEERLAACVQVIGPIGSTYRWEGSVEHAQEWLCLAKTRAECLEGVETAISNIHPYEVPEILATPIVSGSIDYLDWLTGEVTASQAQLSATRDRH